MGKNICFFSAGFAFNRLNRMRFYEKVLPKETNIFLLTTDRWQDKAKESYQFEWAGLNRTKIVSLKYDRTLPWQVRRFCIKNKIDRIINIGNRMSIVLFWFASLFTKTEYLFNMMGWVPIGKEMLRNKIKKEIWDYFFFYFFAFFAKKITSNDLGVYKRFTGKNKPIFFRLFPNKTKVVYLPAPLNTDMFYKTDKIKARKKLGLPLNKNIVIFVGRINPNKCGDVLIELIKRNKDFLFVVIGRSVLKEFEKLLADKPKNLLYYSKKNPQELIDYYNAADVSFLLMRLRGGGLGQTVQESLACGLPAIVRELEGIKDTPALIQIPPERARFTELVYSLKYGTEKSEKALKEFFSKSRSEREKLSKIAQEYALKNYSHKVWALPHIKEYLN